MLFEDKDFPPLNKFLFDNDEDLHRAKELY